MDKIFFHLLYAVSGFCFAVISCRYTILSIKNLLLNWQQGQKTSLAIALILSLCLFATSWVALPYFLYTRSIFAVIVYFLTLLFFLALSYKRRQK